VRFAYITGWRVKSEVLTLEWRHADLRLIRSRGHLPKGGGYDGQNGIEQGPPASPAAVQ
jgi:hypothetical protein